jgi:adenosylcobinamide-GDP ribazoletransferase
LLKSPLAALAFLTWFPATRLRDRSQQDISNSRIYFPLVGLLLGAALVVVELGASFVFPPHLTAALLVVLMLVVTRGLHIDGLMDVCDGLFGGATPERRMEIMRDSRVGAFAVAGAGGVLLLKYGALVSLLALGPPGKELALLLFPMISRWTMVAALAAFPYARSQGMGSPFHQGNIWPATILAAAAAGLAAVLIGGIGGVGILVGATCMAWVLGRGMFKMLGGLTGDTYGAINELVEAAVLAAAVALIPHGWLEPLPRLLGWI